MSMALARALSPADGDAIEDGLVALHRAGADSVEAIRLAASELVVGLASLQGRISQQDLRGREMSVLREILGTGAEGNYIDYISAEQAFMAVQMLVIEVDDPWLEDQLDKIADTLNDDERYRPGQFAAMLASLAEPEPDVETDDEPATE
jgi:hypothetical protein